MKPTIQADVIIIGAGAAGLMCAIEAGKRGRKVIVVDHANKAGKKILMSGGGRCNFTNYHIGFDNFLSENPHFCKSALSRYTQWHFIELVEKHRIPYHEKAHGQLFCNNKSRDILEMLLSECERLKVDIRLRSNIEQIQHLGQHCFQLQTQDINFRSEALVIATGGLSIPTMGATGFGYQIATQFGLNVIPTRAGLVPLTLHDKDKHRFATLSGTAVASTVEVCQTKFIENILFTHRGLSGPAILQISSYWNPGDTIEIDMLPNIPLIEHLRSKKCTQPKMSLKRLVAEFLPKKLITVFIESQLAEKPLSSLTEEDITKVAGRLHAWRIQPNNTEGYRTAEVTLGGIDCSQVSSKTMEVNTVSGLYFIGEVLDVSGWLGGYNFQWAWSSGWAAGQVA